MPKSQGKKPSGTTSPPNQLPGFTRWNLPDDIRHDERIKNRWFPTLPSDLWSCMDRSLLEHFDQEEVLFEQRVSQLCEARRACMGLRNGEPVDYELLEEKPLAPGNFADVQAGWGKNTPQIERIMRLGLARLQQLKKVTRGDAGWLLERRDFGEEHDHLLGKWSNLIARWGIPQVGPTMERAEVIGAIGGVRGANKEDVSEFVGDFSLFYSRWRLQGLAAPYLPVPLQPLLAATLPATIVRQLENAGGIFFLPDTFPVPSRDELRGLLDDGIHASEPPDHLAPWMHIVRASYPARNKIARHARRLRLHHYWCTLHHRHAAALRGQISKLEGVFARFLKAAQQTVRTDRLTIRRQLGPSWPQRQCADLP